MEFFKREEVGEFMDCLPGVLAWIMPVTNPRCGYHASLWVQGDTTLAASEIYQTVDAAKAAILARLAAAQWSTPGVF